MQDRYHGHGAVAADASMFSSCRLSVREAQSSASGSGSRDCVIKGQLAESCVFSARYSACSGRRSFSSTIASTGHSGMHTPQSMQTAGSITRKFGPSWKHSTGHTATQSVYLQQMHASVTTWVMLCSRTLHPPLPGEGRGGGKMRRGGGGRKRKSSCRASLHLDRGQRQLRELAHVRVAVVQGAFEVRDRTGIADLAERDHRFLAQVAHRVLQRLAQHRHGGARLELPQAA